MVVHGLERFADRKELLSQLKPGELSGPLPSVVASEGGEGGLLTEYQMVEHFYTEDLAGLAKSPRKDHIFGRGRGIS